MVSAARPLRRAVLGTSPNPASCVRPARSRETGPGVWIGAGLRRAEGSQPVRVNSKYTF